jgi:hypothetical protein
MEKILMEIGALLAAAFKVPAINSLITEAVKTIIQDILKIDVKPLAARIVAYASAGLIAFAAHYHVPFVPQLLGQYQGALDALVVAGLSYAVHDLVLVLQKLAYKAAEKLS